MTSNVASRRTTGRPLPAGGGRRAWVGAALMALLLTGLPPVLAQTATTAAGDNQPRLMNAAIRYGLSPAIAADSAAQFNFTVANPGTAPAPVEVRLEPEGGGTVYTKSQTIPPGTIWEDTMPVLTSPVEAYAVTLLTRGEVIAKDKALVRLESGSRRILVLINDDPDYAGLSDSLRDPNLFQKTAVAGIRALQAPESWERYGDAAAVVLAKPDARQLNQRQLQALDDFVRRGGTLLWIHPEGALAAAGTPLASLLPVRPLRLRSCEDFRFLRAWAGLPAGLDSKLQPRGGRLFLEAQPATADGITPLLAPGGLPVIHWQRHGIGLIGWTAFDLTDPVFRQTGVAAAWWNHAWAHAFHAPAGAARGGDAPLGELLSLLCGYRVPGLAVVRNFLVLYVGLVVLVLAAGYLFRRPTTAWLLAALMGIAFSIAVVRTAKQHAARQAERSCTSVTLAAWGGPRQTAESILSLFSKSDDRPAITAPGHDGFFYPMVARAFGGLSRREALTSPLRVTRQKGEDQIESVTVQALKPRRLAMTWSATAATQATAATLTLDGNGQRLTSWPLPSPLADTTAAWLLVPGGALPLRVENGRLTGPVDRLMTLDPTATAAAALVRLGTLPTPSLVLAAPRSGEAPAGLRIGTGDYIPYDYHFTFAPVQIILSGNTLTLPPEWVRLEPGDTRSRLLWRDDAWQPATLRGQQEEYAFNAILPLPVAGWELREVTITLDADNPGGNILFGVELLPPTPPGDNATKAQQRRTGTGIAPTRRTGNTFTFVLPPAATAFQPAASRLGVRLILNQKRALANQLDTERVNRWTINRLQVSPTLTRPAPTGR